MSEIEKNLGKGTTSYETNVIQFPEHNILNISENQIKGNFGENYVSYILSKYCLVRPVASGTDIGIDLYCELILNREPFLHFWVQVKTCKAVSIKQDSASYQFKTSHLQYWYRQPVPVFAFLVPVNWPKNPSKIYVVNITEYLIREGIPTSDTKTLTSNLIIEPENNESLEKFLYEIVPITHAIKKITDGIVAPIPVLSPQYERKYVIGFTKKYVMRILNTIRTTAAFASLDLLKQEEKILN